MTEVCASGIIDASADAVWAGLRDFSGPRNWVRNIVSSDIEEDRPADQVGVVRRLVFDSGNALREKLTALSDHDRYFRYALLPPFDLPIEEYSGKVSVIPLTDGDKAIVHWCGNFTIRTGDHDEVRAWVRSIYQKDIQDMQAYFAKL